jgi:putative nucleotidyltransferase with HDIG domain
MNREEAIKLVRERIANPALVGHSLAVAAVMRALARRLGEDAGRWELAGLLHDIDYEETGGDPLRHGLTAGEMLSGMGVDAETVHAVMAHNQANGTVRETLMDRALYAADPVTGLITACALVRPDRKLAGVEGSSVRKKFKDKAFARGVNREQIDACAALRLDRSEFIELSLAAMKEIAGELEL